MRLAHWQGKAFAILFLVLAAAWNAAGDSGEASRLYEQAHRLMDEAEGSRAKLLQAAEILSELQQKFPESELSWILAGRLILKAGYINRTNYSEESLKLSVQYFHKALAINPDSLDTMVFSAYPYLYQGDLENAKRRAGVAAEIDPDAVRLLFLQGDIAHKEKDWQEEIRLAKRVLASTDDPLFTGFAYSDLANAYRVTKQYGKAEHYYLKIIELKPDSAWSLINYGSFLVKRGEYDKAIDILNRSMQITESGMGHHLLAKAWYGKGRKLYWEDGKPAEGVKSFKNVLRHDPDHANALYGLGLYYYRKGHQSKDQVELYRAEGYYKRAIEADPEHEQAIAQLARLQKLLGWLKKHPAQKKPVKPFTSPPSQG
ncbi:tetratricopeptide repeat protein [Thiogranum longum]|uniref:Tetratricopeptide repeat protein n=1 Tax=Thiogranum longum TaxID=1537524 RepID=A0A4R1HG23_9GAMM|nr:tetratricopeptide repeat protein [Thiogranum longum]TCK18259.1 tetratricopeptide repeat protein [Thiogranum longum]